MIRAKFIERPTVKNLLSKKLIYQQLLQQRHEFMAGA